MKPELIKQLIISAKLIDYKDDEPMIEGVNKFTRLFRDDSTHIEYSIALVETDAGQAIYVIVPGSNDRKDWIANFRFRFQDMVYKAARQVVAGIEAQGFIDLPDVLNDIGLSIPHAHVEGSERWADQRVHSGFLQSYYNIQDRALDTFKKVLDKYPDAKVYGTAHSLGSAILRFLMLDSQFKGFFGDKRVPQIHTFGAPRMGNGAFAQSLIGRVPEITRVVHSHDLVTRLPFPLIGYRHEIDQSHIGKKHFLRWFYRDDIRDHYLSGYIENLEKLLDVS